MKDFKYERAGSFAEAGELLKSSENAKNPSEICP